MSTLCRPLKLASLSLASIGLIGHGLAEINYDVSYRTSGAESFLHVEITCPSTSGMEIFQMPRWEPGAYVYSDFGKSIANFAATDGVGNPVTLSHPDFSTWIVSGHSGNFKIDYDVPTRLDSGAIHYGGPSVYMYVVGRKLEATSLSLTTPQGWRIRTGLDPRGQSDNQFTAPTYDVLADTPVTMGNFLEDTYMSHGKPHYIVMYGVGKADTDQKLLTAACKFVSDTEGTFFGEVPYKRYVWHFNVGKRADGGGGLEHLNGTEITLASGVGPGMQGVLAHEFFHLWNVKRIRAFVLGPFNYQVLPRTGGLWWLEGVTDYYAHTLLARYGWFNEDHLLQDVASNISRTQSEPGHLQVSPYDSSYRVSDASNGRGNSNGYLVSYYTVGWVLGMMLDEQLIIKSNGKYRLDDVELALWNLCKNGKPGFQEGEIRKQLVKFGGDSMGELYDKWVMSPGDLPFKSELANLGLTLTDAVTQTADWPIEYSFDPNTRSLVVSDPRATDLKKGDVITAVDGISLVNGDMMNAFSQLRAHIAGVKPGDPMQITVKRDGNAVQVTTAYAGHENHKYTVTIDPNATAEQVALRKAWELPRKGTSVTPFDRP